MQSAEYLDTVERCAVALGAKLSARDWEMVWQNRREIGPYSVLVELKIAAGVQCSDCACLGHDGHLLERGQCYEPMDCFASLLRRGHRR
jgi:hypothetical protein